MSEATITVTVHMGKADRALEDKKKISAPNSPAVHCEPPGAKQSPCRKARRRRGLLRRFAPRNDGRGLFELISGE